MAIRRPKLTADSSSAMSICIASLMVESICLSIHKAWKAVASTVHKDGFVGYVQGSGDRPASSQPVGYNREPDFDDYGLGCLLLGASEYCKLLKD